MDFIEEENILYMQDDYFLKSEVNHQILNFFYMQFLKHRFDCLHITDQCTSGPFSKNTGIKNIWEINKTAPYRVSTQAAYWNKNTLKMLLRNHESGWQFEHFGSLRSKYFPLRLMCVSQNVIRKNDSEIIPYIFTGIIKGKWKMEVEDLFKKNRLIIDFSNRGFYKKSPSFQARFILFIKRYKDILSILNLIEMKIWHLTKKKLKVTYNEVQDV